MEPWIVLAVEATHRYPVCLGPAMAPIEVLGPVMIDVPVESFSCAVCTLVGAGRLVPVRRDA